LHDQDLFVGVFARADAFDVDIQIPLKKLLIRQQLPAGNWLRFECEPGSNSPDGGSRRTSAGGAIAGGESTGIARKGLTAIALGIGTVGVSGTIGGGVPTGADASIPLSGFTFAHGCAEMIAVNDSKNIVRPGIHVFADEMFLVGLHVPVRIGQQGFRLSITLATPPMSRWI
jgi:hypothetical protein